ncbi:hypothetical protein BHE90_013661 [Fusarium euwallaceae]|uniref:Uncharacterized protein n=1 Tax=Fusarium euwallaceae TaxID=1147111 RepID=A0A430L8A4_9HYPO|nr:hypothetical protein BHE90_013661 [Fusarium euwallaceae]
MDRQCPIIAKIAASGPLTTSGSTQLQTQSAFFTILNEDIRNQICEYLFGCTTVNIDPYSQKHHYDISLLCTCQRAYMEGMRIAYSTNVFNFGEGLGEDIWGNRIKTLRWDLIRKVDLRTHLAVDLFMWEQTWELLQAMSCLRSVKLRCEEEIDQVFDCDSGRIVHGIKDPFKRAPFFLPWALRPMLWLTTHDEATFEILFNIERRKTLEVLLKALREREIRGIRIGWVTKSDEKVEIKRPAVSGAGQIGGPRFYTPVDLIEWENV